MEKAAMTSTRAPQFLGGVELRGGGRPACGSLAEPHMCRESLDTAGTSARATIGPGPDWARTRLGRQSSRFVYVCARGHPIMRDAIPQPDRLLPETDCLEYSD